MAFKFLLKRCFSSKQIKFNELTSIFKSIEQVSSRNAKLEIYKNYLSKLVNDKEALRDVIRISMGLYQPRYNEEFEINVAEAIIVQSLGQAFMKSAQDIRSMARNLGDFGDVAAQLVSSASHNNVDTSQLSLENVIEIMNQINEQTGYASMSRKVSLMEQILKQCQSEDEAKYIIRSISKGLRIGLSTKSVERCLLDLSKEGKIEDQLIREFEKDLFGYRIKNGSNDVESENLNLSFNVPIKCMLGRPARDPADVFKQLKKYIDGTGQLVAEYKYDGERTQIHFDGNNCNLFSRNFDTQNQKFWLLKQNLEEYFAHASSTGRIKNCILDGEIVYIGDDGRFLPFQEIERKYKEESPQTNDLPQELQKKLPCVIIFDVLLANGANTCNLDLLKRKEILKEIIEPFHFIQLAHYNVISAQSKEEQIQEQLVKLMKDAYDKQCEGLVVKAAHTQQTFYDTSGKRTGQWVKLKNRGLIGANMRDTLDLIPIGAYYGKGNRKGLFGSFLMSAYNSQQMQFECICKLGTGFTQDDFASLTKKLQKHELKQQPASYKVTKQLLADVWIEPKFVWEVAADSFSQSSIYTLGKGKLESKTYKNVGLSLRFPRFIRERPDKEPKVTLKDIEEESFKSEFGTDVEEIITMYLSDIKTENNQD